MRRAGTSGVDGRRVRPVRGVVVGIVTLVALAAEVGLIGVASAGASTAPAVVNAAGGACQAYTFSDAAYEPTAFGSAVSRNTATGVPITRYADRVTGMASDPAAQGYWLVGANGELFSYGTAPFYGSLPGAGVVPNAPVVGMAAAPTGSGYWEVARDGGIFAFGSARFYGSMGNKSLNQPVVGMAADSATGGYWLVGADGGVFAFTAPFYGSLAGKAPLTNPVASIASTPNGSGYWMLPTIPLVVPGVPVLGEPAPVGEYGPSTVGLGHVEPCQVSFGGDPTSVHTDISWSSWGGAEAVGTGMSTYVAPGQIVATGSVEPVTVVAFDPGVCHGVDMYEAFEEYFPQHGGTFNPNGGYRNLCDGTNVTG